MEQAKNAFLDASHSKKMMTLVGIYIAIVGNLMTSTTNATLLPVAAAEIGGADIYGLAQGISGILSVCIMPVFGYLGARHPSWKRVLCGGSLLIGALVILVRGVAQDMITVIVANFFWGFVSAGIFVIGFAMIRDMFPKEKAGTYLGLVGTMMSVGMLLGPFIGGIFIDRIGWRIFCFMLTALLAGGGCLVLAGVRVKADQVADLVVGGSKMDRFGVVALMLFLGPFIVAISMGDSWIPFGSLENTVLLVVAVVFLVLLVINVAKKGDDAIIPLGALRNRNTLVFSAINFLYNVGAMSITFFVPGFIMTYLSGDPLVGVLGAALAAGLAMSIRAIPGLFLGPVFGKMIAKANDAKGALRIGNVLRIIVIGALALFLAPGLPVWIIYVFMVLAGIFTSQHSVTMSAGPQIQLPANLRTTGNSVIQLSQNLGGSIGTALFTFLISVDPVSGMSVCLYVALGAWVLLTIASHFLVQSSEDAADV